MQNQNRSMSMSWYLAALALVDTIALCIVKLNGFGSSPQFYIKLKFSVQFSVYHAII